MVVYTSLTTLPIDLHKHHLMLYAIMIFIMEVWSGLCELTSKEFWPNSTWPYFGYTCNLQSLHNVLNIHNYLEILLP